MLDIVERNVIFSVKPIYAEKILTGQKTVELRRRFANEAVVGSVAFIYASSPVKRMIGYATIADVRILPVELIWREYAQEACIERSDFDTYFHGLERGYAIVLNDVKSFGSSYTAETLKEMFGFRAPQSYQYAAAAYSALIA